MRYYNSKASRLRYAAPHTLVGVGGAASAVLGLLLFLTGWVVSLVPANYFIRPATLAGIVRNLFEMGASLVFVSCLLLLASYLLHKFMPDYEKIRHMVYRGLCCPAYGNPLHLKDGEFLPKVLCVPSNSGRYDITVTGASVGMEDLVKSASRISALINGKFRRYAVVYVDGAPDYHETVFHIEDVAQDWSLTFKGVGEMCNYDPTKLLVQNGTAIDLTSSGSMLVAGKTRSGKTTGIISLLLQVLQHGRDDYGSEVMIIDPKQAELSRLPHVVTLGEDGGAQEILDAIRKYAAIIKERQKALNGLSEQWGNAVHWWDAGMHPSFLFIDEYVALRSLLPKKADKAAPDYSLAEFDDLIKRIVTMGASAGCYVIISIAQASVDEGGLPSMLRAAMSTKILFRPTLEEGRLLWPSPSLDTLAVARKYTPGDARFSSSDGEHDAPSYVHFPHMDFPVYKELGQLLRKYYGN